MDNTYRLPKFKVLEYEILSTLSTGSYGRVRLAKHKITNEFMSIKMLKKAEIIKLKQLDHVISESILIANINHPFILSMHGFSQDERYIYFLLDFLQGGELFTYLRNKGKLDNTEALFYSS